MDGPPLIRSRNQRAPRAAALALGLAALPGLAEEQPVPAEAAGPPAPAESAAEQPAPPEEACRKPGSDGAAIVDKMQRGVYVGVCNTANWFDGLFGTRRYDRDSEETFGRLGLYESWDDRDGFDTRLRMRVRLALPAMEDRLRLFFGRADEREVVEESQPSTGGSVPSSFQRVEDEAWLLGLGYSRNGRMENGFDFGAGIRIRTPVDPFAKGSYRYNLAFTDATAMRARQTVFWRDSRGFGETTEFDIDHLLTPRVLLRWDSTATLAEDVRRLEWTSAFIAFHSLGKRRAVAYTTFINGIANTDVPVRNYGFEARYRRQTFREWLFLEARGSLSWPRDTIYEEREINPGVSVGFEMYFGPVPSEQMR